MKLTFATDSAATDSALTLYDGKPQRELRVFESEAEFFDYQQDVWDKIGGKTNVIAIPHTQVPGLWYCPRAVFQDHSTFQVSELLDGLNGFGDGEMGKEVFQAYCERVEKKIKFVLYFDGFTYYAKPYNRQELEKSVVWYGNQEG